MTVKEIDTETDTSNDCNIGMACAQVITKDESNTVGPGFHILNVTIKVENPPLNNEQICTPVCQTVDVKYQWTHSKDLDGVDYTPSIEYKYIDPTMKHEFGHSLGLHDFYKYSDLQSLPAIMRGSRFETIRDEDTKQLYAIYARHPRH